MQKMEHDLIHETNLAHKIHQALSLHTTINPPIEGGSIPGRFGQFSFHVPDTNDYFNIFINKSRVMFKVDCFKDSTHLQMPAAFCKAFNIKIDLVDKVINAYLNSAKKLVSSGIISINLEHADRFAINPENYLAFTTFYNQADVNSLCLLAHLKFNEAYKKNKRYHDGQKFQIISQLHFYYDDDNNIKPVVIIKTYFDQEYELSFIVDIHDGKIYASKKVLMARTYKELISMSRPIPEENLESSMDEKFMSRLIPIIKKRYGLKKEDIHLDNIDMRDRYLSLLMMETI